MLTVYKPKGSVIGSVSPKSWTGIGMGNPPIQPTYTSTNSGHYTWLNKYVFNLDLRSATLLLDGSRSYIMHL